ncbi:Cullin family-domain-containing protein [Mycena olivaceomarginata]|nr:Cullin family-domain-containing protein [Mycena olivaceomarginata]
MVDQIFLWAEFIISMYKDCIWVHDPQAREIKKLWVPRNVFSVVQQHVDGAELSVEGVRNTFPEWEFPLLEGGGGVADFAEKKVSRDFADRYPLGPYRSNSTLGASGRLQDLTADFLKHYKTKPFSTTRRPSGIVTTGANYLNRLFTYLHRYWVKRERDEGKKAVYQLALAQWLQHRSSRPSPPPSCAWSLLSATVRRSTRRSYDSFVSLGLDAPNPNKECLDVYKEQFEAPFLAATEAYYAAEAEAFLNAGGTEGSGNIPEYLKKAGGGCARRRRGWCGICMRRCGRSWWGSVRTCYCGRTRRGCGNPLGCVPGPARLRRRRGPAAHVRPRVHPRGARAAAQEIRGARQGAVSALVGAQGAVGAAADADAKSAELVPKVYVDALLAVHEQNAATVARSFKAEAGFAAALDRACREFVNRNAATGAFSLCFSYRTSAARSPELLAKYADMLLRKSNKVAGDVDLEGALNRVYLEDKDVFQTFYTTKLSKRLIHGVSASDEAEASMISKLKEACGFEYTNKLQRMFTDMSLSKDLTDSFKERMAQNHVDMNIAFSIMVLGTNFWPLAPPTHDFLLPPELLPTFERFTRYYQTKAPLRPQADVAAQLLEERAAEKLHEPEVHPDDVGLPGGGAAAVQPQRHAVAVGAAGGDEDLDRDSGAGVGAAGEGEGAGE